MLAEAALRRPQAIVCLLTALRCITSLRSLHTGSGFSTAPYAIGEQRSFTNGQRIIEIDHTTGTE